MNRFLVFYFFVNVHVVTFASDVKIEELLKNKQLSFKFKLINSALSYNENEGHNMQVEITNRGRLSEVKWPNGVMLDELSNQQQNQVLVEHYDTFIRHNQTLVLPFHSYCIELSHSAINKNSKFVIMPITDTNYSKTAQWIEQNQCYNHGVQSAFWCISDNREIHLIHNKNKEKTMLLWSLIANILKKKMPDSEMYLENYTIVDTINKKLEFELPSSLFVEAGVYNNHGKMIYKFVDKFCQKGKYSFDYELYKDKFPYEVLYVKLMLNWSQMYKVRFAFN
jgi:hypothetical protein